MSEYRIHLRPQLREAARRYLFHSPNLPHHHRPDLPRFANACVYGGAKYINRFHGLARMRVQRLCTSTAHLAFAENTNSLMRARHRRLAAVVLISALGCGIAIRQIQTRGKKTSKIFRVWPRRVEEAKKLEGLLILLFGIAGDVVLTRL